MSSEVCEQGRGGCCVCGRVLSSLSAIFYVDNFYTFLQLVTAIQTPHQGFWARLLG
jgi:hypothetical protein